MLLIRDLARGDDLLLALTILDALALLVTGAHLRPRPCPWEADLGA